MRVSQDASRNQDFAIMSKTQQDPVAEPATSDSNSEELGLGPRATYIPTGAGADLTQEHRDYLLQRHGTLDLDPIPSDDPADPYNWPHWKKVANLVVVGFSAFMTTFTGSAIIPAYEPIAMEFHCSITKASYLTSLQIMVLGVAPLFWKPLSQRYGRRPIWLISMIGALAFNIGCAVSHSYNAMATCRAFTSFFISPAMAYGSGVVTETFFKKQRAQYMGIWTLLVTLGPPAGPFFMGFVTYHTGNFRWIYWILAITSGVQFIAFLLFAPETRYIRRGVEHRGSAFAQEYLQFRRIDPAPLRPYEFIQPLALARYPSVVIPTVAYAIVFGFASVLLTVEIPQLFIPKFGFNPQQIGLQFLSIIVGSIIGAQLAGRLSDIWMQRVGGKNGRKPAPEFRLWLSHGAFALTVVGLIVFGVQLDHAKQGHWNITPIIGIAIAAAGNQMLTTILVTYAIDSHIEHSASVGTFINVIRSTWGFIGPFWFPDMLTSLGATASMGLSAGIVVAAGWIPITILHWARQRRSSAQPPPPVITAEKLEVEEREAAH